MIPAHLSQYVARQDYAKYTPIDHASWRYILRVSRRFFKEHAHSKYLTGLSLTGIETEQIPRIKDMSRKLKKFGWQAVPVTGFIPPAVFLEFLSLSILPIACDIRRLEHLEYTPSPDIVHEAAGHAPIISDRQFATYLHQFGEIARKAIFAQEDLEIYESIKWLSDLKESPRATKNNVAAAYARLDRASAAVDYTSEASKLSRLGWWSTEYGLIRQNQEDKIYGAGLLSSVGESYNCFMQKVPRRPLSIDCVDVGYDITKPQPQLFYIENFQQLKKVIQELTGQMSFKIGGLEGLARAKRARTITTVELDSGLQVSGVVSGVHTLKMGEIGNPWQKGHDAVFGLTFEKSKLAEEKYGAVYYLQISGPAQLSMSDRELKGHSAHYHQHGYGTPLGLLKNLKKYPSGLTHADFVKMGFAKGKKGRMEFESGVVVEGYLKKVLTGRIRGRASNLVLTFSDCTVSRGDQIFFQPSWGNFDLISGQKILSVFGGAADRGKYILATGRLKPQSRSQSSTVTKENRSLLPLYRDIRALREKLLRIKKKSRNQKFDFQWLEKRVHLLNKNHPKDWLLRLEILEIVSLIGVRKSPELAAFAKKIESELQGIGQQDPTVGTLIRRGLDLI
jgi:phenylalanine-4-hydroxylase